MHIATKVFRKQFLIKKIYSQQFFQIKPCCMDLCMFFLGVLYVDCLVLCYSFVGQVSEGFGRNRKRTPQNGETVRGRTHVRYTGIC